MKDWKAKDRLHRIREEKQRVELLRRRMELCDSDELQQALAEAEQVLKCVTVEGMSLIGRLRDTSQQVVMLSRYVDMQSWEEIAAGMATSVRAVQKIHGRALPMLEKEMEEVLEKEMEGDTDYGKESI